MSRLSVLVLAATAACAAASPAFAFDTPLPASQSTVRVDIGSETERQTTTGGSAGASKILEIPNPYAGNLGERSSFPNLASASAGNRGGPKDPVQPFVYASALSSGPTVKASANEVYSFKIESDLQTSVLVDVSSVFAMALGYQALEPNSVPTINYGAIGPYATAEVDITILSASGGVAEFQSRCGVGSNNCLIVNDVELPWKNQATLMTNTLYTVSMLAFAQAYSPQRIDNTYIDTFAHAYIDPYFSIAASVANPEAFRFVFSPGIENLPPGAAAPEPAAWALMIGGLGLTGLALRRRRRVTTPA